MEIRPGAVARLKDLLAEENNPDLMLRVFVQGGGCAGFQYGFNFEETRQDDDFEFKYDNICVLVDALSMQYLQGAAIDFREDIMGSSFVIDNPQAVSTCGCGSSFTV